MNTLRESLQDYLELRRSLGFKMHDAGLLLPRFVSFMEERQAVYITTRLALEWAQLPSVQPAEWAKRLCFVRGFARHRSASDSRTEIPPVGLLPHRSTRARPHLYTEEEIRQLLDAALELPVTWPSTPLRPWVFHCLIGLLSVAGLRISEALNLELGDVDLDSRNQARPLAPGTASSHHLCRLGGLLQAPRTVLQSPNLLLCLRLTLRQPATFIEPSTRCRKRQGCAPWARARARGCTTFGTASPFRF